ncbi:MAG TPA: copper resistance CopC family protein [Caulobacterales bacterium]|nr:copper resistance CopC family protein [Caulobacterales bacterium]
MKRLLLALAAFAATAGAAAAQPQPMGGMSGQMGDMPGMDHGHMNMSGSMLSASDPAEGAALAHAPRTISLTFAHPVLLQTVSVVGPNNSGIAATFRRPTAPTATYGIALPASLASGAYTVNWTASGMGHTMQGALHFTVQ